MLVIVGLIVLLLVGLVAIVGVLTNAGAGHPPIENFVVFGYHPTGSTGTLFLLGIMVGVVASLGFAALITGARRSASRAADTRRVAARIRRETAFINRDHDTRFEHQQRADIAPNVTPAEGVPTHQLKRPTSLPTQSF
ncbi:hypothetical protein [Mycobacterium sp.]|uniref:hypothetical protein n=1 Tax=Mycobacterium sp. TaxID=1785 RepID=UPI002D823DDB|nr:hypothetical protein [Mycobacterium sp.]